MGVTTCSSHLPVLVNKVQAAKYSKNSAAKVAGEHNYQIPSLKRASPLEKAGSGANSHYHYHELLLNMSVAAGLSGTSGSRKTVNLATGFTKIRSLKALAQLWQRKAVTRMGKSMCCGWGFVQGRWVEAGGTRGRGGTAGTTQPWQSGSCGVPTHQQHLLFQKSNYKSISMWQKHIKINCLNRRAIYTCLA